jgi:hypothetical protein
MSTAGNFFAGALELFGEIAMLYSAAKRQFDTLAAPRPSWEDVTNQLGGNRALCVIPCITSPGLRVVISVPPNSESDCGSMTA